MDNKSMSTNIEMGTFFDKDIDEKVELSRSTGKILTRKDVGKVESFEELGLAKLLSSNITMAGFTKPSAIQKYAMKSIQNGKDLMACSQTGSGKTAAFLIPVINKLMKERSTFSRPGICYPRALILTPTRELAMQIHKEAVKFSTRSLIKCESLYGGTDVKYQEERVRKGASIVVGTVGRVKHFLEGRIISLEKTQFIILDEADRLLNKEHYEDVKAIMTNKRTASTKDRQTIMFSQSQLGSRAQDLVKGMMKDDFLIIAVDCIGAPNRNITQEFVPVVGLPVAKERKLLKIMLAENMKYNVDEDSKILNKKTLIFVSSKHMVNYLKTFLSEKNGIPAVAFHGDLGQDERESSLNEFRSGRTNILIATGGIAGRGLDITGVDHVINYEMPKDIDEYVHRIGRTGRVGNTGRSTSFVNATTNGSIIRPLVIHLVQAKQDVPEWLRKNSGLSKLEMLGYGTSNNEWGNDNGW